MHRTPRRAVFALGGAVCALAAALLPHFDPPVRAADADKIEKALDAWRNARSGALRDRIEAAHKLAVTRHPLALRELLAEYGRDARNQDKVREFLARDLAAEFGGTEFVPALRAAMTERLRSPDDAWLVREVVGAWAQAGRTDAAIDFYLRAEGLPFHQAAALRAMSGAPEPRAFALANEVIAMLPEAEPQRTLLYTAAARVIEANVPQDDVVAARAAVLPILEHLDEKQTTRRTATVIGRTLSRILRSEAVYADATSWRQFLDDADAAAKMARDGYAVPARSYFAGVLLTGRDIVYVIDCSGSMKAPFTWRPTEPPTTPGPDAPKGPVTGKGRADAEKRRREAEARREQDIFKSLKALPWDKIRTRLDAVREALKASLRALQDDQRFAVVVFSDGARYMSSATHLVPATRSHVEDVCADVDRLEADGATNVHRALELGFGASRTRIEDPATGTGLDQNLQGADTLVLLTDGSPTTDSYDGSQFSSLYTATGNLLNAAERWNLFPDGEIDCVGIADAPTDLLDALARRGNGRSNYLGR